MTDNEFVKDVERRLEERESLGIFVIRELVEIAKRQKAEIERLEKELDVYKEANILIAKQRDSRDEDIANLEAENETLKTNNTSLCVTLQSRARVERAEAIKEFAERLKVRFPRGEQWLPIHDTNLDVVIDTLLKEMVGE